MYPGTKLQILWEVGTRVLLQPVRVRHWYFDFFHQNRYFIPTIINYVWKLVHILIAIFPRFLLKDFVPHHFNAELRACCPVVWLFCPDYTDASPNILWEPCAPVTSCVGLPVISVQGPSWGQILVILTIDRIVKHDNQVDSLSSWSL